MEKPTKQVKATFDIKNNTLRIESPEGFEQVLQIQSAPANDPLASLPPQLVKAVQQYRNRYEKEEVTIKDLKSSFRNIWYQRVLLLGAGEIMAILLFTYSFIFIGTFLQFANTTSFFPWTWQTDYT